MATFSIFDVEFEVVKKSAGGVSGPTYAYRRGSRRATIKAASAHPADILPTLNADIAMNAGEVIEIISIRPGPVSGTEDGQVLA